MPSLYQLVGNELTSNLLHILLILFCFLLGVLIESRPKAQAGTESTRLPFSEEKLALGLLCLALVTGAGLRFYGLSWGLPSPYHPDEFEESTFLRNMMANGSINSHYYQQPPLILYLSWPISILLKMFGYFADDTIVRNVFAGRIVNACAGTATIALTFLLGKRVSSSLFGAFAALLVSVAPLHVTNSRYMKQDALLVLFVVACALAALKAAQTKRLPYLYFAGVLGGLAMGSKYSGAACAGIILGSTILWSEKPSFRAIFRILPHALGAVAVLVCCFLLCTPQVLISAEEFNDLRNGMAFESKHARTGHHGYAIDAWSQHWMFHLSRSLIPGTDLLVVIAALISIGLYSRRFTSLALWLVAIIFMFYLPAEWARSKPPPQPDRYVLPLVPFVALLAAELVRSLSLYASRMGVVLSACLVAALPLTRSVLLASEIKVDTRYQMTSWLGQNLPAGAKIIKLGAAAYLPRIPNKFRAQSAGKILSKDKSRVIEELRDSGYDYLVTTNFSGGRFRVENVTPGNERKLAIRDAIRKIDRTLPIVHRIAPRWGSYGFHNPTITVYSLK